MSPNDSNAQHVVTAVIVAHDGVRWLPDVTRAVREQARPVDRVVAVDTGSRDRSGTLLTKLFGNGSVFGADRGTGFGAAVAQALRHRAANTPVAAAGVAAAVSGAVSGGASAGLAAGQGSAGETVEWVWLLHDDCAPDQHALGCLLDAASASRGAVVLGPKVRDWEDQRVIIEAGITIDGAGRRETGLEPNELDQGQHDGERDVLAVGSAGMLIRRDVWDRLGGFDPSLRLFRDDIDFCWRVIAAGYRVKLVTDAVVHHVEASARFCRPISVTGGPRAGRPRHLDRRNALFVLFANLPAVPMFAAVCRSVVGTLLRTLILIVGKQPGIAWDELTALASVLAHPLRLLRARRRRGQGRRRAYPVARSFIPKGKTVGRITEIIGTALAGSQPAAYSRAGRSSRAGGSSEEDEESLLTDSGLAQRLITNPGVLTILGLTVIALVAERSLLRGGWLGGGALVPVWGGSSDLWREYLAGYHDVGLGSGANAPPYVAVLALLSTILGGKPWLAVDVLLLGCVPLAGITAYLAARRVTAHTSARVWAACTYALLPVATGAIAAGRIGAAVAFVLVPVIAILVGRTLTLPGRRGRRSAWAAALVVAVAAAFVPLVWAVSLVGAVLAFVAFGRGRRELVINFGLVALVPAVLLAPWTLDLLTHPSLFLLEAGVQRQGMASPRLSASALFLLSPGGPGLPPVWVTAGLVLAGLVALLANRRHLLVAAGSGVALLGLLTAITLSRIKVAPPAGGPAMPAWPGVALTFTAGGVLLAAITVAESWPGMLRAGGLRRIGGAAIALFACSAPALVAATWVIGGVRGPLTGTGSSVLPEFVTASATGGLQLRTLVLRSGPLGYTVLRNSDPLPGEPELAQPVAARRMLDSVVAGLATGSGADLGDDGHTLGGFAIGYVLLPAPMSPVLVRVLDGTPGLRPVSLTGSFGLWQVTDVAARVRVVEPGGAVVPVRSGRVDVTGASVPSAGGTLVLAEPAGASWHASLNGRPLTPLGSPVDGWAQGFRLPAGGGRLSITRSTLARQITLVLEAVAVAVVVALALPSARAQAVAQDKEQSAEGSATSRGRGQRTPAEAKLSKRARGVPGGRPATSGRPAGSAAADRVPPRTVAPHGRGARSGPDSGISTGTRPGGRARPGAHPAGTQPAVLPGSGVDPRPSSPGSPLPAGSRSPATQGAAGPLRPDSPAESGHYRQLPEQQLPDQEAAGPKGGGPKGGGPKGGAPAGAGPAGAGSKGAGSKGAGPKGAGPKGAGPKGAGPKGAGPAGPAPGNAASAGAAPGNTETA